MTRCQSCGLALVLWSTLPGTGTAAQSCFEYESARVEVLGRISVEQVYGSPNYGEEPATGSKERFLLLTLDAPICVNPDPDDLVNSEGESGLSSLHLVYHTDNSFKREWLGARVIITGTLFHAFAAHHRTPVLITVSETRTVSGE